MINLSELYKDYEFCCDQWKKVLDDEVITSMFMFSLVLSRVSIKIYDKKNNILELAYNPRHEAIMPMWKDNEDMLEIIRKYFGKMDIVFKANSSIVDPEILRNEDERIQRNIFND